MGGRASLQVRLGIRMLLYQLGLLVFLLPVCTFAPGFFFVRRLRWNPLEKLCGSIGLSLILLYLASWGIYCVGVRRGNRMPVHPLPYAVVSLVSVAMAVVSWKDIGRLLRATADARRALAGFGFLVLWTAILVANHPQLFRRGVVRRLAGTLSTEPVLPAAFSRRDADLPWLCLAGQATHDERADGVFPGADRGPLRTVPISFHLSEPAAVSALLPHDAGAVRFLAALRARLGLHATDLCCSPPPCGHAPAHFAHAIMVASRVRGEVTPLASNNPKEDHFASQL